MAHPPDLPTHSDTKIWEVALRKQIEAYLLPQVQDAKDAFERKLREAPVDEITRNKLAHEHNDTLKNLRRIATDLFKDQKAQAQALGAPGVQVGPMYSVDLVKQQQAIMEQLQREKEEGPTGSNLMNSVANQGRQRSQWTPTESPTSERDGEYFPRKTAPRSASYADEDRTARRPRNGSGASGFDPRSSSERVGDYSRSAIVDEPEEMGPGRPYPEGPGSLRRQSNVASKPIPEFWKPSISPENEAVMSKTFTLARRGSVASMGSNSYRSPSTPQFADRPDHVLARQGSVSSMGPNSYRSPSATQFSERSEHRSVTRQGSIASIGPYPYRPPSTNQILERPELIHDDLDDIAARSEREKSGIRAAEEEWSEMDKARGRDRPGWKADNRHRTSNGTRAETEDYASFPSFNSVSSTPVSATSPSYITSSGSRPIEIPQRSYPLAPPAGRPNTNEGSFSIEESGRYPQSISPVSPGWAGPTRTLTESTTSRSPPGVFDGSRTQQSAHVRQRLSTQDFQHGRRPPVARRQTFSKESQAPDLDDIDQLKEEQERQAELEANARRKEEEVRLIEEEATRKEEEARRKEAEARRRAEEAERLEKEAKAKEEAARLKEEETRKKEAEIKRREEDVKRREQELERREAEAQRKEEEKRQRQLNESRIRGADAERREGGVERQEEQLKRREEEQLREELETEEAIRLVQELERQEEEKRKDDERQKIQQEEFRKREEEIRLRAFQRRSQEEYDYYSVENTRPAPAKPSTSPLSTSPRPIPNRSGSAGNVSQADRNGTSSSSYTSSSSRSNFKASTTPASSVRTSTASTNPKAASNTPRSTGFSGPGVRTGTSSPTPEEMAEWNRRQEEQARKQQEALLKEQEQQEMKRLAEASKGVNKEDALKLFEVHERQWADLPTSDWLNWYSFPWPAWSKPKNPDDLISANISQYVVLQYQLGKKPPKPWKDHIKEHIKRWHPDRFETRLLPKVIQGDREKVREGAGQVARALNELLTRSSHDPHVIL